MPQEEKIWWFEANGERLGPYSETVLRTLVVNGKIAPTDLVWKKGMTEWMPFEDRHHQWLQEDALDADSVKETPPKRKKVKREIFIFGLLWVVLSLVFGGILWLTSLLAGPYESVALLEIAADSANVLHVEGKLHNHSVGGGRARIQQIRFVGVDGWTTDMDCRSLQDEFCAKQLRSLSGDPMGPLQVRMTLVRYRGGYWPITVESGKRVILNAATSFRRFEDRVNRQTPWWHGFLLNVAMSGVLAFTIFVVRLSGFGSEMSSKE